MRRKVYFAAILAAVMAFQMPLAAFAEGTYGDVTITDEGWNPYPDAEEETDPEYSVGSWQGGDSNTVTTGNVTSTVSQKLTDGDGNQYYPVAVDAAGGTVQVNGNVSASNSAAVMAENDENGNGGTVKVTGNVTSGIDDGSAVTAFGDGNTVEIGGNVVNTGTGRGQDGDNTYGTSNGIDVTGASTVKVGGDVTTKSGTGIYANAWNEENDSAKGTVNVGGSVSSAMDAAIAMNAASEVTVAGNATGNTGISIVLNGSGGKVEVLGTVKSVQDYASVICIETDKTDKDAIISALPEIIVGSLEGAAGSPEDYLFVSGVEDGDEAVRDEVYEAVYNSILYYIAQDKFANATMSVSGASAYKNGYTSKEGNSLTVTIRTADGYEISSVSGTSVVRNSDGTYTVLVQRGKGIDINAVISAIESIDPAYAIAQEQFQKAITEQVKVLPAGGTLTLDLSKSAMKNCISFNRKTFEILAQRKDVNIQIIYMWKGKKYLVVIPAGYDILSLLNKEGYCGCLYLNSIFGSTEITNK